MGNNRKEKRAKQQATTAASKSTAVDIPEEEQWRIINQTGILKQAVAAEKGGKKNTADEDEDYEISPLADEIFRALYLVIPTSFMLLLMEILVHYQYGRKPSYDALWDRMLPGIPIIAVFVFYTNRYKEDRRMQAVLFWLSCVAGMRLIWLLNRGNWLTVMQQAPPIATSWVYAVVQLNLGPAVLSLVVAGVYTWYNEFKLTL